MSTSREFEGQVAFVTGGATGIGLAVSRLLAEPIHRRAHRNKFSHHTQLARACDARATWSASSVATSPVGNQPPRSGLQGMTPTPSASQTGINSHSKERSSRL